MSDQWDARATCPACDWSGMMEHWTDDDGETRAFCANPEPVDADVDDDGQAFSVYCENGEHGDGFAVMPRRRDAVMP